MTEEKKNTMKDFPESERPYEKCRDYGAGALSDADLLAVIIGSGCRRKTAYDLSVELMRHSRGREGLSSVLEMTMEELCCVEGIGWIKAVRIMCIAEIVKRISRMTARDRIELSSPASIAAYFMQDMRNLGQEEVRAAFFDTKMHLVAAVTLTRGTVDASVITPREIYISALEHHAVSIVLIHNHPSGDATPSRDDIELTRRIRLAGELVGIRLLDHIVLGDGRYVSLKEQEII